MSAGALCLDSLFNNPIPDVNCLYCLLSHVLHVSINTAVLPILCLHAHEYELMFQIICWFTIVMACPL